MAIRRLRSRPSPDVLPNEARRRRQAVIQFVYFSSILLLGLWLGNLFLGGFFYLRSEGQVLAEPAIIGVEFAATVRSLPVHEGEHVRVGETVAVISSQTVSEGLARLTADQADRELRLGAANIRSATINAVIGLAQRRETVASDTRRKLETLPAGFVANDRHTAALDAEYRSSEDLAQLTAEKEALTQQIADLSKSVAESASAISTLRDLYDGGVLRSPIDGIVGRRLAENGSVVGPGQPIMELYKNNRFVLAFLPTGRLFSIRPGDSVSINTGLESFTGTVARIDPVAGTLPPEFQRSFAPLERGQLVRIDFNAGQTPPPLFTKVGIRPNYGLLGRLLLSRWL